MTNTNTMKAFEEFSGKKDKVKKIIRAMESDGCDQGHDARTVDSWSSDEVEQFMAEFGDYLD